MCDSSIIMTLVHDFFKAFLMVNALLIINFDADIYKKNSNVSQTHN